MGRVRNLVEDLLLNLVPNLAANQTKIFATNLAENLPVMLGEYPDRNFYFQIKQISEIRLLKSR